jgi:hypothetical protein
MDDGDETQISAIIRGSRLYKVIYLLMKALETDSRVRRIYTQGLGYTRARFKLLGQSSIWRNTTTGIRSWKGR